MNSKKKITGLLISAGLSSRMVDFKPLLLYDNLPFVVLIAKKMLAVCDELILVTGFRNEDIICVINDFKKNGTLAESKINIIFNADYKNGMFTSLKAGISFVKSQDWFLYHFVDQPDIPAEFYSEFIKKIDDGADWIQPSVNSRKGHPVLFNKKIADKISNADTDDNLKNIAQNTEFIKLIWECGYSQVLHDMDTKDDLNLLHLND